jgi:large subunit ribosomal protein L11
MIAQKLKLKAGSGEPNKTFVGELTDQQVTEIAQEKMPDMNTTDLDSAKRSVMGAARSMGVTIK